MATTGKEAAIEPVLTRIVNSEVAASSRLPIYGLLNAAFVLYVIVASSVGSDANPRLFYVSLLFAICSSPVLFVKKANDRFSMYTVFFVVYFISFGAMDLVSLTSTAPALSPATGFLSAPEALIIIGGLLFAVGYQMAVRRRDTASFAVADWPMKTLTIVGIFLWAAGTYATWYWNIHLTVRAGEFNNHTGQGVTTILMLGRYAQPMGLLTIAYAYTISRSNILTAITIVLAVFQVYLGFVSDTKGGAMLGGILVIVTGYLVKGKIPKMWGLAAILFILLIFPIFQAHRLFVVGERGQSNASSVENFSKSLQVSVDSQGRAAAEHAESFFQRSSVKSAVEMIVNKTGDSVPYQNGYTLIPLVTAFIPRLLWPDKLDVQTGELVNTEFHVTGERVTYISPSYLGELYWNFGWIGASVGMLLLGLLFGWINARCDLSVSTSVTRLLILGITVLQLGVRFEASIATEYAVWLRSIVAILFMHWLFARSSAASASAPHSVLQKTRGTLTEPNPFPNLLR